MKNNVDLLNIKPPKFHPEMNFTSLMCPRCGYDCLHQRDVIFYGRNEDDEKGFKAHISNDNWKFTESKNFGEWKVNISDNIDNSPSLRRIGMTIEFICEECESITKMDIMQHKGRTYIDFK